jgi:hypothetical protein
MPERKAVAVRAYAVPVDNKRKGALDQLSPSHTRLILNVRVRTSSDETFTFGAYREIGASGKERTGLFYDPANLTAQEITQLEAFTSANGLALSRRDDFVVKVFYRIVYRASGVCIGYDLPFVISRLAIHYGKARKGMAGGFSFQLRPDKYPRVRVKHPSSRAASIGFTSTKRMGGGRRPLPRPRYGHFADLRTLAGAILGDKWSLRRLAAHLGIEYANPPECQTREISEDVIQHAVAEVEAMAGAYVQLQRHYDGLGLTKTLMSSLFSEATVSKACFREIGVTPWDIDDLPPETIGAIMSTQHGGRCEVRRRKCIDHVLYLDFRSMYSSICALMGVWQFVIANGVACEVVTKETRALLEKITLDDLRDPKLWASLFVIVEVHPDGDLFPVRAHYGRVRGGVARGRAQPDSTGFRGQTAPCGTRWPT